MVWKKVENADAGTTDKFGGNDTDKISDLFSGVNVADPVDIGTDWDFNTKFDLSRSAVDAHGDPAANKGRFIIEQLDSNNDALYVRLKQGGSYAKIRLL